MAKKRTHVELLGPAGSMEAFEAALNYGADAIYLGASDLNARNEKAQFKEEDLPELVRRASEKGVKIYLTLNILLYDSELEKALNLARQAMEAGVSAFIVQDRGLISILRQELPSMPIHASTQTTCGTKEGILAYRKLGCSRVVLPRELSLEEIEDLTSYAHSLDVETEVFVHGALCMSVSGQCHMSHFLGGRSANRGDCAQACRQSYKLLQDGADFRDWDAYLSPKDISAFPILDKLLETGVDGLKIEGRLRRPDYVGQTVAVFRRVIDSLGRGDKAASVLNSERERDLKIAYNRGGDFTDAFYLDQRGKDFLSSDRTGHYGLYLGSVNGVRAYQGEIEIRPDRHLDQAYLPKKDSIISLRDRSGAEIASAPCGLIDRKGPFITAKGFHPKVLEKLSLPLEAYQMNQEENEDQAYLDRHVNKRPVDLRLYEEDGLIKLAMADDSFETVFREDFLDTKASPIDRPIEPERVKQQLEKLGQTPFEARKVLIECNLYWRISDLNRFRRAAVAYFLAEEREQRRADRSFEALAQTKPDLSTDVAVRGVVYLAFWSGEKLPQALLEEKKDIILLLPAGKFLAMNKEHRQAFLEALPTNVHMGLHLPSESTPDLDMALQSLDGDSPIRIWGAGPSGIADRAIRQSGKDASNMSSIQLSLQGNQLWNSRTWSLLEEEGNHYILLSPELDTAETMALLDRINKTKAGAKALYWAYGRTQAMYTRFCPVGYSQGKKGCRLCLDHQYSLLDQRGRIFPLRPEREEDCSLQIFQSEALDRTLAYNNLKALPYLVFTDEDNKTMEDILAKVLG